MMNIKTFDQQTFSDHAKGVYGDCMRACVYTLLQQDVELPHPIGKDGLFSYDFFEVLEEKTGKMLTYRPREKEHWPDLVIRCGTSPRGIRHAVVWCRSSGTMLHDPHPSRVGLINFHGWYVLA